MLSSLSPRAQFFLFEADYSLELLIDKKTAPFVRVFCQNQYPYHYASYYHAFPEFIDMDTRLKILDAPCTAELYISVYKLGCTRLVAHHLDWARALKFECAELKFEDCSLAQFLAIVRDSNTVMRLHKSYGLLYAMGEEFVYEQLWSFYATDLETQAQALGRDAFQGLRCTQFRPNLDVDLDWQALGFTTQHL